MKRESEDNLLRVYIGEMGKCLITVRVVKMTRLSGNNDQE